MTDTKERASNFIFIILCMGCLLIPSVGMFIRPTQISYENRELAELPSLWSADGTFNRAFFDGLSDYVADHIALRDQLTAAQAIAEERIFSVSARDSVIAGDRDWLYYTATLDDYLHVDQISDRELYNIAHNVYLIQEYCTLLGKKFLFTIPPNKNSLYDEQMPAVYRRERERNIENGRAESDFERLLPYLEAEGVHYIDLDRLFSEQEAVLYYRKDSHWNNEGARLVYNALLDELGIGHENYEDLEPAITNDYIGDLNQMLYGAAAQPEEALHYLNSKDYFYYENGEAVTAPDSDMVEENEVETINPLGKGNLLMYRDSFGNSLIPFLSEHFSYAYYSKIVPYPLSDLVTKLPDYVIIEKVERHLPTLAEVAPVMSAPLRTFSAERMEAAWSPATLAASYDGVFYRFSGDLTPYSFKVNAPELQEELLKDDSLHILSDDCKIYIEIEDAGAVTDYEAFLTSKSVDGEAHDHCFDCYVPALSALEPDAVVRVIAETDGKYLIAAQEKLGSLL